MYIPYKPLPPFALPVARATTLSGAAGLTAISVLFCSSPLAGFGQPFVNWVSVILHYPIGKTQFYHHLFYKIHSVQLR